MIPTPRFVTCVKHDTQLGNAKEYAWDQDKISVNPALTDDILMLQNVFEAKIISSTIYPLIFEASCPSIPQITLRSLEFYKQLHQDPTLYQKLSSEEKSHFLIGIRDLFVASCRNLLSEEEKELLKSMVDLIDPFDNDPDIVTKKVVNLDVTPYPTSKNKMVKFIDISTEETLLDECFIRNELNLLICFVDPQDLSYHNFENIINLDSLFDENYDRFKITNMQKYKNADVFTFDMTDKSGMLKSLDQCGLYTQPLNKMSRGGQRFIFSSEILSKNLSESIVRYMKHPQLTNKKFRFVNYVFRYNKFKPGDKKFVSHYDTSYHNPSRKHHSKYTLLLYLTSGSADPVLSFGDGKVQIKSIDTKGGIKGIIFDQKYEHEGKAYIEGDKIFIRSELIYEYDDDEFIVDNEVSKKFNIACYMTKQSLFTPEVEKYSSDMFNQAAKARVSIAKNFNLPELFLYKRYKNTDFVTNGYDYWFQKSVSLRQAAAFAILDHFNCKLNQDEESFNKLTYQKVIKLDLTDINQIFDYLASQSSNQHLASQSSSQKGINVKRELLTDYYQKKEMKGNMEIEDIQEAMIEPEITKTKKTIETRFSYSDQLRYKIACKNGNNNNKKSFYIRDQDSDLAKEDFVESDIDASDKEEKVVEEMVADIKSPALSDEEKEEDDDTSDDDYYWRKREPNCCYKHFEWSFDPSKSKSVKKLKLKLQILQNRRRHELKDKFPIFIMDKMIEISPKNILIGENVISFQDTIPEFNFANSSYGFYSEMMEYEYKNDCWKYGKYQKIDFIASKQKKAILYNNLPSIPYKVFDQGYHLKLELFQNNLLRKAEETLEQYYYA